MIKQFQVIVLRHIPFSLQTVYIILWFRNHGFKQIFQTNNVTCFVSGSEVLNDNEVPILHVTKFICEKHLNNIINLPETFRDFCVSSQLDSNQGNYYL